MSQRIYQKAFIIGKPVLIATLKKTTVLPIKLLRRQLFGKGTITAVFLMLVDHMHAGLNFKNAILLKH